MEPASSSSARRAHHDEPAESAELVRQADASGQISRWVAERTNLSTVADQPITTLMVCNLPCHYNIREVAGLLDILGFARRYDWLHLLSGEKSGRPTRSNLGYGFVNFITPEDAERFGRVYSGYQLVGATPPRVGMVRPAYVQGFEQLAELMQQSMRRNSFRGTVRCTT